MNALSRFSRSVSLALCASLLAASFPTQAAAAVITSVPRSVPTGVPVALPARALYQAPSTLNLSAAHLDASLTPTLAPSLTLSAAQNAPAPAPAPQPVEQPSGPRGPIVNRPGLMEQPQAVSAPQAAPAGAVIPAGELSAPAEAPEAAAWNTGEAAFKADARASAVADGSAISRGFAALRRAFSTRKAETLAAADAPVAGASAASKTAAPLAPASKLAAANDGKDVPPAPPAAPQTPEESPKPEKGGLLGLGAPALSFIIALLVAQVGVEAMGNAMPVLVQQVFGSFAVVAQIAIFSSIAGIIGRQFAPIVIQKYGLRNVYLATELLRMLSITGMLALLATGHIGLTGMMAFYSFNGLVGGVALTAETSIPPTLVGQDELKIQRFWTWEQTLLEIVGIVGPIAAGSAVDAYGASTVLIAYPVAFLAALILLFVTLRIPAKVELMRKADLLAAKNAPHDPAAERVNAGALRAGLWSTSVLALLAAAGIALKTSALLSAPVLGALAVAGALALLASRLGSRLKKDALTLNKTENVFGGFFARIARGAKLVWDNKPLRYAFIAFSVYSMLNPFLYSIIAPAYGLLIGGQAGFGGIFGTVAGLYSLGGLLGGIYMAVEQGRIDKKKAKGEMDDAAVNETLRKSMLRMMLLTIPMLAAFATVFIPNPAFLAGLAIPYPFISGYFIAPGTVTLFSLALIPFGFAQVISMVKLRSYFQAKVPDAAKNMSDAMGFFGSASLIVTTIGLQGLSFLFQHTHGMTPFMVYAGLLVPLAVFFFLITRKLSGAGKP